MAVCTAGAGSAPKGGNFSWSFVPIVSATFRRTINACHPVAQAARDRTKSGISKVYFTELPKEVQERFNYESEKAAAYSAEQNAAIERQNQQFEQAQEREAAARREAALKWQEQQRQAALQQQKAQQQEAEQLRAAMKLRSQQAEARKRHEEQQKAEARARRKQATDEALLRNAEWRARKDERRRHHNAYETGYRNAYEN
jgi:hypothetical protein